MAANCPDLNPIEHIWGLMKDYIELHYGHIDKSKPQDLRVMVLEAWDSIEPRMCTP